MTPSPRWAALGLTAPASALADAAPPFARAATLADALFAALAVDEPDDPIDGIMMGVREELLALADLMGDSEGQAILRMLAERLSLACTLLAIADGRQQFAGAREEAGR